MRLSVTMMNRLVIILTIISGFSIMAIELLGSRLLAPYFGSSISVWGSLITVFMVALALGYLLGGRWSLHAPSLHKFGYCYLFSALTLIPLVSWGEPIMNFVFLHIRDQRYGSLVSSILLFFIPTVIMGMISPYAIRLLVRQQQHSGQIAGALYFASTLGSALGTLLTSFYLVLWFEVNTILWALVGILGTCGIIAWWTPANTEARI